MPPKLVPPNHLNYLCPLRFAPGFISGKNAGRSSLSRTERLSQESAVILLPFKSWVVSSDQHGCFASHGTRATHLRAATLYLLSPPTGRGCLVTGVFTLRDAAWLWTGVREQIARQF